MILSFRNTKTVGITSLGLEHTSILGNTLTDIAWQKAGIIKQNSDVFTVPQPDECMETIRNRCADRNVRSSWFLMKSKISNAAAVTHNLSLVSSFLSQLFVMPTKNSRLNKQFNICRLHCTSFHHLKTINGLILQQ